MLVVAIDDFTKASKLVNVIELELDSSLNQSKYLLDVCLVLIDQKHQPLTDLAVSMLEEIGECIAIIHNQYSLLIIGQPIPTHLSASLEYITLREMLADLVDLLAGNAPVITQLNNHLFSSGLIPNAVHIDAQNTVLSPTERANKMIDAVLAILECHPNPNSAFTSLITALRKVGLTTIATKLMECLSKFMHH